MSDHIKKPENVEAEAEIAARPFNGFTMESLKEKAIAAVTPFNVVAAIILAIGLPICYIRFTQGIGAVSNLSDTYPWGLWIGFDVLCGVALAAGGYVTASTVYIFGLKEYHPVVRPAILTGFLGYFFVVVGLLFDLGRPWRLPFPMFISQGPTSVMFLVAWHVALYLSVQFLEFSPAVFEWLGWKRVRRFVASMTIGATIFGVILSTLHQSALGALFLLTPGKMHPLWYSSYIPVFFFVSSIAAGLSMVIFESTLSHRFFKEQVEPGSHHQLDKITMGLGKAAAVVLFTYFCLKWMGVAHDNNWHYLQTPYGYWFLVEVYFFVMLPALLYISGIRKDSVLRVRVAAALGVIGIIVNRLNISLVAFNWNAAERYIPRWTEVWISITIVTVGLITFRWMVNHMPVLKEHPEWKGKH